MKVLILFPFEWASYSTPVLNLVEALSKKHDVKVICVESGQFDLSGLSPDRFKRVKIGEADEATLESMALVALFNRFKLPHSRHPEYEIRKMIRLLDELRDPKLHETDLVIAVDSLGLLLTSQIFSPVVYFSLELCRDEYLDVSGVEDISLVITQSRARFEYLFGDRRIEAHIIENTHPFTGRFARACDKSLVYFGNLTGSHAMHRFIDVIRHLDPEYSLTLAGILVGEPRAWIEREFAHEIGEGRLILHDHYVNQNDVVEFLKGYSIGLCFYDFEALAYRAQSECTDFSRFDSSSRPVRELYTATKIFGYFAAGLPVIGSDIPSMRHVRSHGCGELLEEPDPAGIAEAARRIASDYDRHVEGAFHAAEILDFNSSVEKLIEEMASLPASKRRAGGAGAAENRLSLLTRFTARMTSGLRRRRQKLLKNIRARIHEILAEVGQEPLVIYGAGEHTRDLLFHTSLGLANITGVADGNEKLWGKRICGFKIGSAAEIMTGSKHVLVSSFAAQSTIVEKLLITCDNGIKVHIVYPMK